MFTIFLSGRKILFSKNGCGMILIGLGSNKSFCGKVPAEIVSAAMEAVAQLGVPGAQVLRSSLYKSDAWPDPNDPPYINGVVGLAKTTLAPEVMLAALQAIEDGFGRERAYLTGEGARYAPRTLDLDLLSFHDECRDEGDLTLPHPGLATRSFVLVPLVEILPAWAHPVSGQTAAVMCSVIDENTVRKLAII